MAFPADYTLLQKITIDKDKVSGSANLTDFPVYLSTSEFLTNTFDNTDNGGGDLRFSSDEAGSSQLSCEVVSWVTGTDEAQVWVKTTVDHDDDTVIYVWGDNTTETQPARDAAFGSEDVWSNGYQGVWHLQSDGTDDSDNGYNVVAGTVPDYVEAKIGNGGDFEMGDSEYLTIANASCANLNISGNQTWSAWIKPESLTGKNVIMSKDMTTSRGVFLFLRSTGVVSFGSEDLSTTQAQSAASSVVAGSWSHVCGVYDSTNSKLKIFVNGTKVEVSSSNTISTTAPFCIGAWMVGAGSETFDGIIDEVRVENVARTDGWNITQYNNQNSPSTFAIGATVPGIKELSGVAQANIQAVQTKTLNAKGRITTYSTQTVGAKGHIQQSFTQTISALGRITASGEQTVNALGRITQTNTQTVDALGRIARQRTETIEARARIQLSSGQTITALGRITIATSQTISALGRIQKSSSQSVGALGRIKKQSSQTIYAKAAIGETFTQTIDTKGRIGFQSTQEISVLGRITSTNTQTISALGRIQHIRTRTIGAKGRITIASSQSIKAKASISKSATRTINAKAAILKNFDQTIQSIGRIGFASTQTISAKGRITQTNIQTVGALGRIAISTSRTISALGRIEKSFAQNISSLGRITKQADKTIAAKARIIIPSTQSLTSKGNIKAQVDRTIDAKGRITGSRTQTIQAKAAIAKSFSQTIAALGRITVSQESTVTAKGNIARTTSQTIDAKGRIKKLSEYNIEAKASIRVVELQTIEVKAKIVCITKTVLVSPAHLTVTTTPVILVWEIPTCCKERNIHACVQINREDDNFTDLESELFSYRDSDFEYWDGDSWEPYPEGGVAPAYYGNQARLTISLSLGIKYWRVRGGVK